MPWRANKKEEAFVWTVAVDLDSYNYVPKKTYVKDLRKYNKRNPKDQLQGHEDIKDCQSECDLLNSQ